MALRVRPQHFPVYCDIDTRQIMRASKMVASYTGIAVQANKAIVGANAFAHESGIHQHGVLKHSATYEIMTPESVGVEETDGRGSLVLGKHSGKAAYRQRLIELGYGDVAADKAQLDRVVEGAKAVADKKKTLSDADLEALVSDTIYNAVYEETYELSDLVVTSASKEAGKYISSTATVTLLTKDGEQRMKAAVGVGPIDATFKAILSILDRPVQLTQYSVSKIEGGSGPGHAGNDALASVVTHIQPSSGDKLDMVPEMPADYPGHQGVRVLEDPTGFVGVVKTNAKAATYTGTGTSTDIIVASARAYITALNRMLDADSKRASRTSNGA